MALPDMELGFPADTLVVRLYYVMPVTTGQDDWPWDDSRVLRRALE